jgi:hemolysin activation/secretion protein
MKSLRPVALHVAAGLLLAVPASHAQTNPDAGNLLRDIDRSQPRSPSTVPPSPAPSRAAAPAPTGIKVRVKEFVLTGVQEFPESDVQAVLEPWRGRTVSISDLRQAVDAITDLYRDRGFLVRALLPDQNIQNGVVQITVLEGKLGDIRIERQRGASHLPDAAVRAHLTARQALGQIVRPDDLQRAISILNDLPGLGANSMLEPGAREGESRLVVSIEDKPLLSGMAQADNSGARASGEQRATLSANLNSALGVGDQFQFLLNKTSGQTFGRVGVSVPVGADGLRAAVSVSDLGYAYDQNATRYDGAARVAGGSLTYPLVRTARRSITASVNLDHKRFDNAVANVSISSKTVAVATASLNGEWLDEWWGGGVLQAGLTLVGGRLDLSGNAADLASDQVANGPARQGHFSRVQWSLTRLQRITAADTLALVATGQQTPDNLDSSEKFLATGPYGVRAYSSSEPSGDEGSQASIEWRHQFSESFGVTLFQDWARLRRDRREHASTLAPNVFSLSGHGIALTWGKPSVVQVRASVAWRSGDNPVRNAVTGADSDGTRRQPRVFVSALKTF